ncbi:hypothetical protein BJV74DRAFT_788563, partial [Russula compacta]
DKLILCYEGKGEQRIIHLFNEVFCTTFSITEALKLQINALDCATCSVTALGLTLEDKIITFAIISSLPPHSLL